jgi:hypothetical protein
LKAGPGRPRASHLVHLDRLRQALHRHRTEWRDLHPALGKLQRIGRDHDGPWQGGLLHAGGEMGRLAHSRVVHVEVAPDGADHNFTRVQSHTDRGGQPGGPPGFLRVRFHGFLHLERRIARPHRVILVSERRPEEGHDAVAHDLVDGALVAVHGLHHSLQYRVEDLARLLRIAVGEQLHRALEVGEEDRDLFALALEGGL